MKTGVLHTIEASQLHLNGYKSEQEQAVTFDTLETLHYISRKLHNSTNYTRENYTTTLDSTLEETTLEETTLRNLRVHYNSKILHYNYTKLHYSSRKLHYTYRKTSRKLQYNSTKLHTTTENFQKTPALLHQLKHEKLKQLEHCKCPNRCWHYKS